MILGRDNFVFGIGTGPIYPGSSYGTLSVCCFFDNRASSVYYEKINQIVFTPYSVSSMMTRKAGRIPGGAFLKVYRYSVTFL